MLPFISDLPEIRIRNLHPYQHQVSRQQFYAFVFLILILFMLLSLFPIVLFCCLIGPMKLSPQLLDVRLTITITQARVSHPKINVYGKNGMSPKHQKVWTKPCSEKQCTVLHMSHSGHPILPIPPDMAGKSAKHIDECEAESLTGPVSFRPVGCSTHLLHLCQIT